MPTFHIGNSKTPVYQVDLKKIRQTRWRRGFQTVLQQSSIPQMVTYIWKHKLSVSFWHSLLTALTSAVRCMWHQLLQLFMGLRSIIRSIHDNTHGHVEESEIILDFLFLLTVRFDIFFWHEIELTHHKTSWQLANILFLTHTLSVAADCGTDPRSDQRQHEVLQHFRFAISIRSRVRVSWHLFQFGGNNTPSTFLLG